MTDFLFYFECGEYKENVQLDSLRLMNGFIHSLKMKSDVSISDLKIEVDDPKITLKVQQDLLTIDLTKKEQLDHAQLIVTYSEFTKPRIFDITCIPFVDSSYLVGTFVSSAKKNRRVIFCPNGRGFIEPRKVFPWIRRIDIINFSLDVHSFEINIMTKPKEDLEETDIYYPLFTYDPIHDEIKGKVVLERYYSDEADSLYIIEGHNHQEDIFFREDKK